MPSNKRRKNTKNKKHKEHVRRPLIFPDDIGQIYGRITNVLGSRYFDVICLDKKIRRCRVRSKRLRISLDDVIIVSLREYDDKNGDIIYKYDLNEIRELKSLGNLPNLFDSTENTSSNQLDDKIDDNECAFDFETI